MNINILKTILGILLFCALLSVGFAKQSPVKKRDDKGLENTQNFEDIDEEPILESPASPGQSTKKQKVTTERVGCICMDGTHSQATAQGACAKHGGVMYWIRADGSIEYPKNKKKDTKGFFHAWNIIDILLAIIQIVFGVLLCYFLWLKIRKMKATR